jgi:hypothetical protein
MGRVNATIGSLLLAGFAFGEAVAADLPVKATPPSVFAPALGPSTAIWLGGAAKGRAYAGFAGAVTALNGNLGTDGFLVRGQYLYAGWDFSSTASPTGTADGTLHRGDLQVGYQMIRGGITYAGFVGVDYQNYRISPAVADDGRLKDQAGAIFTGRVASADASRTPFAVEGNYSTANSTYWVRGRIGYNFGWVTVGPEIGALGNRVFDEGRYGAFASFPVNPNFLVQINGGYADRWRGDDVFGGNPTSAYGGVTAVFLR